MRNQRSLVTWFSWGFVAVFIALIVPRAAWSAPVTTRTYPGGAPCNTTIQACVDGANAGDVINMLPGHYTESFTVTKAISLAGAGADLTVLHAAPNQRLLLIQASSSADIHISALSVTGGDAALEFGSLPQDGGGILAQYAHQVVVDGVVISGNTATGSGGGLYGYPEITVTVKNSRFLNNLAADSGGGMWAGPLNLINTQFISNTAGSDGGVESASASVDASRFERNSAGGRGGGLYAIGPWITSTTFISNVTTSSSGGGGGGLSAVGFANLVRDDFEANQTAFAAGAAYLFTAGNITATRFINNTAGKGTGGVVFGTLNPGGRIVNSLFVSNTVASGFAADLTIQHASYYTQPVTAIINSTFAGVGLNPKAAIWFDGPHDLYITNTIVTNHSLGIYGDHVTQDYNLFFGNTTNTQGVLGAGGAHDLSGTDPLFANPAAGDYHLLAGSPAIDTGTNAGVTTDFDGQPRPIGGGFDIGFDEFLSLPNRLYLSFVAR